MDVLQEQGVEALYAKLLEDGSAVSGRASWDTRVGAALTLGSSRKYGPVQQHAVEASVHQHWRGGGTYEVQWRRSVGDPLPATQHIPRDVTLSTWPTGRRCCRASVQPAGCAWPCQRGIFGRLQANS